MSLIVSGAKGRVDAFSKGVLKAAVGAENAVASRAYSNLNAVQNAKNFHIST
jgi:hypothetical protein